MSEDVALKFSLDNNPFLAGLRGMTDGMGGFKGALAAVGAAVGALALSKFIGDAIKLGDELKRMSEVTGISASTLSKFRVAAELSDTSMQQVAGTMRFLQRSMVEASDTTSEAGRVFTALGIDAKKALDMDPGDLLQEVGKKIAGISDNGQH